MEKPYLSIIIPAYNESERILETLFSVDAYLRYVPYRAEIIVVDDGSRDNTFAIVERLSKSIKNLTVIKNRRNKGKGGVVRQGMLFASGELRLFMDADNATSLDQVSKLLPWVEQGYEVVFGSRAVKGALLDPPESFLRRAAGKGLNLVVQSLLLPGVWDTQCGFKLFTAKAAENIFSRAKISGWGFDVELLSLAHHAGYRIKEVPVRWGNRDGSHVKASAGFHFLRDVMKIRWRLSRKQNGRQEQILAPDHS